MMRGHDWLWCALVCVLSVASVGCSRNTPPDATVSAAAGELDVPAAQIYEPPHLEAGERRPLLVFLHGLGSSGREAFASWDLATFGAQERVFVVAPDGSIDSQRRRFWNAGAACCNFDHREIDDVGRITRLLDRWRARADVDPSRVYVVGHSNGGFMTQRLACALGDRIAAAASLAGAAPARGTACPVSHAVALLEVHGDADPIVRYEGGSVFDTPLLPAFPSAQEGLQDWAKRLRCAEPARRGAPLDLEPSLPGAETNVEEFADCPGGSVALWTVHGGTHGLGMNSRAFREVWRFLSAHHHG